MYSNVVCVCEVSKMCYSVARLNKEHALLPVRPDSYMIYMYMYVALFFRIDATDSTSCARKVVRAT